MKTANTDIISLQQAYLYKGQKLLNIQEDGNLKIRNVLQQNILGA